MNGRNLKSSTSFWMSSKYIEINVFSTQALVKGFDQMWGAREVLCRLDDLSVKWNWKHQQQ